MIRNGPANSHRAMHKRIVVDQGAAKTHSCTGCEDPALDWALQPGGESLVCPDTGLSFSSRPEDYRPMCRPCHKRLDVTSETRAKIGAASANPTEAQRAARRENARKIPKEAILRGLEKTKIMRRRCVDCGHLSNPAGMGKHLKGSPYRAAHSGWENA